jgi:hypothetical protein
MNSLTLPNRRLIHKGTPRGVLQTTTLEDVRDMLVRIEANRQPLDDERPLRNLHVSFEDKVMRARFLTLKGAEPKEYLVSETAAGHLAQMVLPPRFFSGLKQLIELDADSHKVATLAWAKFASQERTPRLIRTINTTLQNGKVAPIIRSVHSQQYATYSNLEFVQELLDAADGISDLPVVHTHLSDDHFRLRLLLTSDVPDTKKPVPTIDIWNSETGCGATKLTAGLFRLICTNGMGSWHEKSAYRWIHRGATGRVSRGVRSAVETLRMSVEGVNAAYEKALNIAIDDAYEWLRQQMEGEYSDRVIEAAVSGINHPTTTPDHRLASAVDAVALIAQDETDIIEQYKLEQLSSSLLRRGILLAEKNNGRIEVEA